MIQIFFKKSKLKSDTKSLRYIVWAARMVAQNFIQTHPVVIGIFQSEPLWLSDCTDRMAKSKA